MAKNDAGAAISHASFWDGRYANAADGSQPTHEWFRDFASLEPFFSKHLFATQSPSSRPRILHLGSGDSTIPHDLLVHKGYDNQLCLDFSTVVVQRMRLRYSALLPGVRWEDMKDVASSSVDVAFDKGTLDAMIFGSPWGPPEEVRRSSRRYMEEVQRVLKDEGFFLYITYRQPHFVQPLLNQSRGWELNMEVLDGGDRFEYFGYEMTKRWVR